MPHLSTLFANPDTSEEGTETMTNTPVRNYAEQSDAELFGAERVIQEKLGKEPGNPAYYLELADIYTALFDRTRKQKGKQSSEWLWKSGDALEKVVMLDPANKVSRYNLGVVYKRQGQMERAREELKKLIRACDPKEDGAMLFASWMEIGSIYEEQGFWDEAREAYLNAREYDYTNSDVQAALQDIQQKRQQDRSGGSYAPMGMPSSSGMSASSMTAPDPSQDTSMNQGLAQAIPALGQMFAQKFSGSQNGQSND